MDVLVRRNRKGRAVYATRAFRHGEVIGAFTGRVRTPKTLAYHGDGFLTASINPLQIGQGRYLDADPPLLYVNHSCDPNAAIRGRSTLVAIRPIKAGDEITFDYSMTIDESFICRCGAKNCRGAIVDFFGLSPRLRSRYFLAGALQDFIVRSWVRRIGGKCPCGSGQKFKKCARAHF